MQEVFEKIIEKLNCKKAYFKRFYECEGKSEYDADLNKSTQLAFDDAIEIVKQEAENFGRDTNVGSNGWIPCSERLPTTEEYQRGNGRFLVTDGNRTYEAEFDIYESHTFGKSRMATDWFVIDKCVTHWQNEPLPPKSYQPNGE